MAGPRDNGFAALSIPFGFDIQLADRSSLNLRSGLLARILDLETTTVLIGFGATFSIPGGDGPAVDLSPQLFFPAFFAPGASGGPVITSIGSVTFAGRVYLYL